MIKVKCVKRLRKGFNPTLVSFQLNAVLMNSLERHNLTPDVFPFQLNLEMCKTEIAQR